MKKYLAKDILNIPAIAVFFVCISFNSCVPVYYAPSSSNAPLFKEKGEARINTYYSAADEISGAEIQGALAVSKSIGIMLNTEFMSSKGGGEDGNGHLIEAGAGYYKPFNRNFVFETYGGLGLGSAKNNYSDDDSYTPSSSKVNFTKCFIQPDIGFTVKNFDFGVTSKFSAVFMSVKEDKQYDKDELDYIRANPTSFFWEPSAFVRAGFKTVKLQGQYTYSSNLNNNDLLRENHIWSIGLSFNIQPKKQTTANKK